MTTMSFKRRLEAVAAQRANEGAETVSVFSADNVKAALDVGDRGHNIHPSLITDWLETTVALCTALNDDELFNSYENRVGDTILKDFTDGHALINKLIWSCSKQVEYHHERLMKNGQFIAGFRDKAKHGAEIEMDALARCLRTGAQIEAQIAFWEELLDQMKHAFKEVTGSSYKDSKPRATPLANDAAKALVGALDEMLKGTSRASVG